VAGGDGSLSDAGEELEAEGKVGVGVRVGH
jgi:hypothetical protein